MRKSGSSTAARACSRKGDFYMQVRLTTPLTRQELAPLHAGDTVLLTGTVYTARDAAHARLAGNGSVDVYAGYSGIVRQHAAEDARQLALRPVSYTHLTLPTIA